MRKKIFMTLLIILCVLLSFIFLMVGIWILNARSQESGAVLHPEEPVLDEQQEERDIYIYDEEDMKLFETYQEYNSDVVGIITIEDTVLNHPVMQTVSDEEYYLYKDLDKKYNSHGVPFLSAASLMEGQGGNCIVYGHNIYKISRDVFADLAEYKDLKFYKEHPLIKTVSKSGTRRWLIFAYFIVDNSDSEPFQYSDITEFNSMKAFDEYFKEVEKRNWLNVPVEISFGDTFLTLSSCSRELSGQGTNRMVVIAKQLYADEEYGSFVEGAVMAEEPLLPEKLR